MDVPISAAGKPAFRGWLHAVAAALALPAGLLLTLQCDSLSHRVGSAVFAVCAAATFGISAVYHRLARTDRARQLWQRIDHAGIHLLIVGSYVPLCIAALPSSTAVPLLIGVGAVGATGAALRLWAFERTRAVGIALYLALGWGIVALTPQLLERVDHTALLLFVVGGLLYTVGVPVLLLKRPDPWPRIFGYHEVWHTLTVLAAGAHFGTVAIAL